MVKSIIFDWDGTLGMTLHLWLEGYRIELKKLGYDYSDDVIIKDFFYEHDKATMKYPAIDFTALVQEVHQYIMGHVSSLKIYTGASAALEQLRSGGITLTLVSSSPRRLLKESLEQTGLAKFFLVFMGGDDVMLHKPSPEPFFNIIEVAKLDPRTTIIVGDSHNDIIAAYAAGVRSCLFLPNENKMFYDFGELKKTNPTHCVESLQEFVDLVMSINQATMK